MKTIYVVQRLAGPDSAWTDKEAADRRAAALGVVAIEAVLYDDGDVPPDSVATVEQEYDGTSAG